MKQFDALNDQHIVHGFFGRQGGVSSGIFTSLNCGLGSGDDRQAVLANREIVAAAVEASAQQIVTAHQVHSSRAIIVREVWGPDNRPEVDGMATNVPGIVLGVLTADCGPVLLSDGEAGVIGALHGSWKGALAGITDATVLQMEALGAKRSRMTAVLGPTISAAAYEVGPEFLDQFSAASDRRFFTDSTRQGHYMFDLPAYLVFRMKDFGIGTVINSDLCTYRNDQTYFSYRRATHRKEKDYGRQIAVISLKKVP